MFEYRYRSEGTRRHFFDTAISIELPYPDPPSAAISSEPGVPVGILLADNIEMNQAKMPDLDIMMPIDHDHEDRTTTVCLCLM